MKELEFQTYIKNKKQLVDKHLPSYIEQLEVPKQLKEAMLYSLNAGGKRIRPILLFATMNAFGKNEDMAIDIACALEMLHTYSLIHDDLPAMDNDDLRRGKPTNHKVFGEAMAILAGDALLTYSFELLSSVEHLEISPYHHLELIKLLAQAAGPEGMVGGQALDLLAENVRIPLAELEYIHQNKTGKLLTFAVLAGALLSNATETQLEYLRQFAFHLGLAFQIKDDILDVEGDEALLGKRVGSDIDQMKNTYPLLLTLEGAKEKCNEHYEQALEMLHKAEINHALLEQLTKYIVIREN